MKYLKHTFVLMVTLLFMLMLPSCNSDIFVEDFKSDVSQISMSGEGGTTTIRFRSDDWDKLDLSVQYDEHFDRIVTPLGGEPYAGYSLTGDGCISAFNDMTDILVTRRGSEVTVDVKYAIGSDELLIWLTAANSVTHEIHNIDVNIDRVRGYEILDVKYVLDSWGGSMEFDSVELDNLSVTSSSSSEPVTWYPKLPGGGLISVYKMGTSSEEMPVLRSLCGENIPVPTKTYLNWSNWELRGDEAPITIEQSFVILKHYPAYPSPIEVKPGTRATLWAEMEKCTFDATLTVRNVFTGKVSDIWMVLSMYQPEKYVVTHDEI